MRQKDENGCEQDECINYVLREAPKPNTDWKTDESSTTMSAAPVAPGDPGLPHAPVQPTGAGAAPPYPTGANSTLIKCPGSPHCVGTAAPGPSAGAPAGSQVPPIISNGGSSITSWPDLVVSVGFGVLGAIIWL